LWVFLPYQGETICEKNNSGTVSCIGYTRGSIFTILDITKDTISYQFADQTGEGHTISRQQFLNYFMPVRDNIVRHQFPKQERPNIFPD
jgi:hypothetical protein